MLKNFIIRTPCRASVQRIPPPKGRTLTGQIVCYLTRPYRVLPTRAAGRRDAAPPLPYIWHHGRILLRALASGAKEGICWAEIGMGADPVVISSYACTPIGGFLGRL